FYLKNNKKPHTCFLAPPGRGPPTKLSVFSLLMSSNLTSVRVKLTNFKSPKVKALLSKAFTFGL
ncbi:MAG: hypothetical protein ACK5V6_07305, partial [Pseudanabaena sp.]